MDIYGKVRTIAGGRSFIPFRYQGQYEDEETGLYYNRFRYYSPDSGTYLSQDPIGLAGNNPNFYAYVFDSNSEIDLFGLAIWDDLGMSFKDWFDKASPQDITDNIKDVTSKKGLRFVGGKHELFPISQARLAKELGFTADELKKMSVETKRITFVDVLNSEGVLVSGKHHLSSASWHFHDKLINALKQAKTKLEAKKNNCKSS